MSRQRQGCLWNQDDDVIHDQDQHSDSLLQTTRMESSLPDQSSSQSHRGHPEAMVTHSQYSDVNKSIHLTTINKVTMTKTCLNSFTKY